MVRSSTKTPLRSMVSRKKITLGPIAKRIVKNKKFNEVYLQHYTKTDRFKGSNVIFSSSKGNKFETKVINNYLPDYNFPIVREKFEVGNYIPVLYFENKYAPAEEIERHNKKIFDEIYERGQKFSKKQYLYQGIWRKHNGFIILPTQQDQKKNGKTKRKITGRNS